MRNLTLAAYLTLALAGATAEVAELPAAEADLVPMTEVESVETRASLDARLAEMRPNARWGRCFAPKVRTA